MVRDVSTRSSLPAGPFRRNAPFGGDPLSAQPVLPKRRQAGRRDAKCLSSGGLREPWLPVPDSAGRRGVARPTPAGVRRSEVREHAISSACEGSRS